MINMAVKVGNSYVTEAALAYAQDRADEKSDGVLNDLQKQFKDVNFGVASAMSWLYFAVALAFIGISAFIISKAVKSYE